MDGESTPSPVEGWGTSASPLGCREILTPGLCRNGSPKTAVPKGRGRAPTCLNNRNRGKKKKHPTSKKRAEFMSLLSACQHPQEVYWPPKRVWADVSMGCDCSSPADGFLAVLQPGDGCGAGVGSGEGCSHHPPHFFACSCGTAVFGPFVFQRALESEPKHALGTARSSSALFGGSRWLTVEFWDKLPNPKPAGKAAWHAKDGKTPLGIEGLHPTEACGGKGSHWGHP